MFFISVLLLMCSCLNFPYNPKTPSWFFSQKTSILNNFKIWSISNFPKTYHLTLLCMVAFVHEGWGKFTPCLKSQPQQLLTSNLAWIITNILSFVSYKKKLNGGIYLLTSSFLLLRLTKFLKKYARHFNKNTFKRLFICTKLFVTELHFQVKNIFLSWKHIYTYLQ